jgi:argininosuccinate lyase
MLTQAQVSDLARQALVNSDVVEDNFDELFEYYTRTNQMPYGTAKARTGDPYTWIQHRLITKEI